jgi:hypothetical protein
VTSWPPKPPPPYPLPLRGEHRVGVASSNGLTPSRTFTEKHFTSQRYGDNGPAREGSPIGRRYVIRTVEFAPRRIRRDDFWLRSSAIFCASFASLMSTVTFAAALHPR